MTIIYAITCPVSGDVRYVGKTEMPLAKRLASHIMGCKAERDGRSRKNVWMAGIVDSDLIPGIHVLERVPAGGSWQEAEVRWIAHFRSIVGSALLNASNGGSGNSGYVPSAETREKISRAGKARAPYARKPHSDATKAKIAAYMKGRPGPMVGKKHTPETLAKMAATRKKKQMQAQT